MAQNDRTQNGRTQINGTPAALFVEIVVMAGYLYCMDEGRGIYHHSTRMVMYYL